jgi:hypothetical protein
LATYRDKGIEAWLDEQTAPIAAEGLASRPASSRSTMTKAWLILSKRHVCVPRWKVRW